MKTKKFLVLALLTILALVVSAVRAAGCRAGAAPAAVERLRAVVLKNTPPRTRS